jgi:hypothetical protein
MSKAWCESGRCGQFGPVGAACETPDIVQLAAHAFLQGWRGILADCPWVAIHRNATGHVEFASHRGHRVPTARVERRYDAHLSPGGTVELPNLICVLVTGRVTATGQVGRCAVAC